MEPGWEPLSGSEARANLREKSDFQNSRSCRFRIRLTSSSRSAADYAARGTQAGIYELILGLGKGLFAFSPFHTGVCDWLLTNQPLPSCGPTPRLAQGVTWQQLTELPPDAPI